MQNQNSDNPGFTLIELLIVVLIIALLALVGLPNLLEAQTRSKTGRAMADMRAITTALEAYAVEHNAYPHNPALNEKFYVTPVQLTTPVSYLATRPIDPFKVNRNVALPIDPAYKDEQLFFDYYKIVTAAEYLHYATTTGNDLFVIVIDADGALANVANRRAFEKYGKWMQWSIGPDVEFWRAADDFNNPANSSAGLKPPGHLPWGYSFDVPYDPTNGTGSFGNIIRTQLKSDGTHQLD